MSLTAIRQASKKHRSAERARQAGIPGAGAGVVGYYLRVWSDGTAAADPAPHQIMRLLQDGLPVRELARLQAGLAVPMEKLAPLLGISKATLHRRIGAGQRLGPSESDRVVRFARLLGKAIKVLGGEEAARSWLTGPQFGLGGAVPLDYARTELGAREVENLLGRIEHGVYS
jgi:putative toxin-antitoxin system antitoxin component (TIGR02293 family)